MYIYITLPLSALMRSGPEPTSREQRNSEQHCDLKNTCGASAERLCPPGTDGWLIRQRQDMQHFNTSRLSATRLEVLLKGQTKVDKGSFVGVPGAPPIFSN